MSDQSLALTDKTTGMDGIPSVREEGLASLPQFHSFILRAAAKIRQGSGWRPLITGSYLFIYFKVKFAGMKNDNKSWFWVKKQVFAVFQLVCNLKWPKLHQVEQVVNVQLQINSGHVGLFLIYNLKFRSPELFFFASQVKSILQARI